MTQRYGSDVPRLRAGGLLLVALACGQGEPGPRFSFTVRGRWPDPTALTYAIEAERGPVDAATFVEAVERALDAWSKTGVVLFVEESAGADVVFGWRTDTHDACQPFGRDESAAHAGPTLSPTFVHFDADRTWGGADGFSLFQVALHETGHVLGLGHSADERAVMYSVPSADRARLGESDRAGLHSLYGGGRARPGDVRVLAGDGDAHELAILRGVAPPETTELAVFDTDGDGADELLVWRTDARGDGALTIFRFDEGPRLARTTGPLLSSVPPGTQGVLLEGRSGERLLLGIRPDGRFSARRFDDGGRLAAWTPSGPFELTEGLSDLDGDGVLDGTPEPPALPTAGDLDGDGRIERVSR